MHIAWQYIAIMRTFYSFSKQQQQQQQQQRRRRHIKNNGKIDKNKGRITTNETQQSLTLELVLRGCGRS